MMVLYDLTEFLRLSAALNYQLNATAVGRGNTVSILLGRKSLPEGKRGVLLRVLEYLDLAYGPTRRHLGSFAVLHPLRATALLTRGLEKPELLDILAGLLHDKLEDIVPENFDTVYWQYLEERFASLLRSIDPSDEWLLMERLRWLTRDPSEKYYQYIGRLLEQARQAPGVVRVKLADRLDNTLDMRIDIEDPYQGVDFFGIIFQLMFVNSYPGYRPELPHPSEAPLNGAERLYQLFKNAVLLSLIRQNSVARNDPGMRTLFDALAIASRKEAERVALHIFGYHHTDRAEQRKLLMEALEYVREGGISRVTSPSTKQRLDGLFISRFEEAAAAGGPKRFKALYDDKALMIEASIAFVVIFMSFLADPDFYIRGISEEGIQAKS